MGAHFPGDQEVRVSDNERSAALAALGQFYAEGRLSMSETDDRCAAVAGAKNRLDLNKLFHDLPRQEIVPLGGSEMSYTATEVSALHKKGARPRAGLLGLTTVGTITGTAVLAPVTALAPVLLALIPIVFILLYVMKIGPAAWYAPSPRQLERKRLAELRKEEKVRELELRAQRRERTHALTTKAIDAAGNAFGRNKRKR